MLIYRVDIGPGFPAIDNYEEQKMIDDAFTVPAEGQTQRNDFAMKVQIDYDLERIKRDIAETAARHGFSELAFRVDWGTGHMLPDEPDVKVETCMF